MSTEMLTTIVGFATMLIALASGFGWMIQHMNTRFAEVDARIDQGLRDVHLRIDGTRAEANTRFAETNDRIDRGLAEVSTRIDRVVDELTEVKIAIARLEGPPPRLIPVR